MKTNPLFCFFLFGIMVVLGLSFYCFRQSNKQPFGKALVLDTNASLIITNNKANAPAFVLVQTNDVMNSRITEQAIQQNSNNMLIKSNNEMVNISSNQENQEVEYFKIITDSLSGQYAMVNSNKEVVVLKDKNGNVIWSVNIVKALGTISVVGEIKIGSMRLRNDRLIVIVGKGGFSINKRTGEFIYLGAN